MADLSITASSVAAGSGASFGTVKLADANSATAAVRTPYGIAISSAASGQPVIVQRAGDITIGATTAAGTIYCLSDTAGGIMPAADLSSGEYVGMLGVGLGSSQIRMHVWASGVAV